MTAIAVLVLFALIAALVLLSGRAHQWRERGHHLVARLGWIAGGAPVAGALALAALPGAATAAGPVPPTQIGVNVGVPFYSLSRLYANLAIGTPWISQGSDGQHQLRPDELDADHNPLHSPPDGKVLRVLQTPVTSPAGVRFRCTFEGSGELEIGGHVSNVVHSPHLVTFWVNNVQKVELFAAFWKIDPQHPPRNLDCRESDLDPKARFAPDTLARLGRFKVLRFMDLQQTNANAPLTWATRNKPTMLDIDQRDGMAIEDMVELANEAKADPWFTIPWNADADYVTRFARYVHDHLAPGRVVYVEAGNEIWNQSFPASQQAKKEGAARHLAADPNIALVYRYAERTAEVMRLWTAAFADRPTRLVRVAATQAVVPAMAETVLGYRDTARYVDALATAPYFGYEANSFGTRDPDQIFTRLRATVDQAIGFALQNKAVAHKYGKRYLAYEAGQHILFADDVPLLTKLNRDPRMYDLYRYYLDQWRAKVGDVIMLYSSVAGIGWYGAFGLQEYDDQPMSETPKLRAVLDELRR